MLKKAIAYFTAQQNTALRAIDKFAEKLAFDPADEVLTWSINVFEAAGKHRVATQLLFFFSNPAPKTTDCEHLKMAIRGLQSRVRTGSRYPAQSTSPTANLVEQYILAANSAALEYLEGLVEFGKESQ